MTLRQEKVILAGILAVVMPPSFVWVSSIANAHPIPPPHWLVTPLDAALPLMPAAAWAYMSWYPASLAILFAGRENFRRLCLAEFGAFVFCSIAHLLWPVSINRPVLEALTGPSSSVLKAIYALDRPVSLFPSFHAAVPPILLQLRPASRFLRFGLVVWMIAICLSCVLTKQHYVLDVVAGLVVGGIAVAVVDAVRSVVVYSARLTPSSLHTAESETAE
jgi:hypothetical protein